MILQELSQLIFNEEQRKQAHRLIDMNQSEEVQALKDQVKIKSVLDDPAKDEKGNVLPFGEGVHKAYMDFANRGMAMGFDFEDFDGYGGHLQWGEGEEIFGILGHLDVVPEGKDWSDDPFSAKEEDGFIYGRGTTDDKGPMIATLYAMKALKEAGFEPAVRLRLIMGLDEETNWKGIQYYLEKTEKPDFGFTPDGEFPIINGEMGLMIFDLAKKLSPSKVKGLKLTGLTGGNAPNMVADYARAVVNHHEKEYYQRIREKAEDFKASTGYEIKIKGVGKSLELVANGISAHGAHPDLGLNAISILIKFLGELSFVDEGLNEFIDFYNSHIGFDLNGRNIGCYMEDVHSGPLVFNVGFVNLEKEAITLTVNARYPVTCNLDMVYDGIQPVVEKYNVGVVKRYHEAPLFKELDDPLVVNLLKAYVDNTGDTENKPVVMGGGTYARATEGIIAFGGMFPGDEDRMHQKDERISIEGLMKMTHIYADAIINLAGGNFGK